jgi:hypothetical protein
VALISATPAEGQVGRTSVQAAIARSDGRPGWRPIRRFALYGVPQRMSDNPMVSSTRRWRWRW